MNTPAAWETQNAAWLSCALAWLRLRLAWLAECEPDARRGATPASEGARAEDTNTDADAGAADGTASSTAAALRASEAYLASIDGTGAPPSALHLLARRLGLSPFEENVLLLCAAMELDTRVAELCARAQYPAVRPYPTFALALALFDNPAWDLMSPERPLRFWHLIAIGGGEGEPLTVRPLRIDERICSCIKGLNYLDARLAALVTHARTASGATRPQPSQEGAFAAAVEAWESPPEGSRLPLLQLLGTDAAGKLALAFRVAAGFGSELYRLDAEILPEQPAELDLLARLWHRESMLANVALYIELADRDSADEARAVGTLRRFLSRSEGACFVDARDRVSKLGRPSVDIDVAKPTPAEQRTLWNLALRGRGARIYGALATQFDLDATEISRLAAQALAHFGASEGEVFEERLWDACSDSARPTLSHLAQRVDARAEWADLVLPAEQLALLKQICVQVRQRGVVYEDWGFARKVSRGLGISALFSGDSGTGKTMAAEVIANDLRLSLYRIDLSSVVSKYIGETEANLRRLFDAAEDGGAILFFDECDALFGKRSEVKDSHDRYANIEINYLLQRIESFRGLAILATNMRTALDSAFVRRLRFVVNFPFPGVAERKCIWEKAFPAQMPREELDFARLARLNLSGGNIHSAALSAAFLAAHARQPLGMNEIMTAVRTELGKLGRPVNEGELRLVSDQGGAR